MPPVEDLAQPVGVDVVPPVAAGQLGPHPVGGGDPNSQVIVSGSSFADLTAGAFIEFICYGKDSDGGLTVPSAILSLLPASATTRRAWNKVM